MDELTLLALALVCGAAIVVRILTRGQTGADGNAAGCAVDLGKAGLAAVLLIVAWAAAILLINQGGAP